MKRQRRHRGNHENIENDFYLERIIQQPKFESTIEAQVQDGETLQALALRFHCTIAEIKRLNKIDKDNEIYARKTIKVPLTPHSILLETLPDIHKSGQNSPKYKNDNNDDKNINLNKTLYDTNLNEKLLIASVNSSQIQTKNNIIEQQNQKNGNINHIILKSRLKHNTDYIVKDYADEGDDLINEPLLSGVLDESIPQPQPIPLPSKGVFDCSGSDCDISWICLFICILALCFAIPLIYVFYIAEHLEKFHHNSN